MTVALTPMPDERVSAWIAQTEVEYINDRMKAGESRAVAEANANRSRAESFPDGKPLPTHRVFDVTNDGEAVGYLWIGPRIAGSDQWWVFDIEILEEHRRRGYARAALELGQDQAKALGATTIGLNVFGFNSGARELYEQLGYEVTSVQMSKAL